MTGTTGNRHPGRPNLAPPPITTEAPRLESASRDDGRSAAREVTRERPREPHEKYSLDNSRTDPGMSYMWASVRIPYTTLRSPRLDSFRAAGWQLARAEDFPEHSGYRKGSQENDRLVKLGLDQHVEADDPVIKDNSVLMFRPKHMTQEAEGELKQAARQQLNDHLRQQKERSERAIGANRTTMSRTYGGAEQAPADAETEY